MSSRTLMPWISLMTTPAANTPARLPFHSSALLLLAAGDPATTALSDSRTMQSQQHLPWEALVLVMQHLTQDVRLGTCSQVRVGLGSEDYTKCKPVNQ
jgi:hypothetical protein